MINFNEIDLNKIGEKLMEKNYEPLDDFEGITPYEMTGLLHFVFDSKRSPLQINYDVSEAMILKSKFLCDMKYYLEKIHKEQPIKLTKNGNLPKKFCQDLIDDKIETDYWFDKKNIRTETDSFIIHLLHIIGKVSKLTKKSKGKMTLTKQGEKLIKPEKLSDLFFHLFKSYSQKYNWGYTDGYSESWIIQAGFGFTIYLLKKYGTAERLIEFYAEKYLKAFPKVIEDCQGGYFEPERNLRNCYNVRVFERFLCLFGFVKTIGRDNFQTKEKKKYAKTELLDEVFSFIKISPTIR